MKRLFLATACLLAASQVTGEEKKDTGLSGKAQSALESLKKTDDPKEFEKAAKVVTDSRVENAIRGLVAELQTERVVHLLSREQTADERKRNVRILSTLASLPPPFGEEVMLELSKSKTFTKPVMNCCGLEIALLRAMGNVAKPSNKLLSFLEAQIKDPDGFANEAIFALAKLSTPEATKLIQQAIHGKERSAEIKRGWFGATLVLFRNDPAIVKLYQHVLHSEIIDKHLRNGVVQSLFDYKLTDWYSPLELESQAATFPEPPPRKEASTEVLKELLKLADKAFELDIPSETKEGVKKSKKEIEAILAERKSDKK